ncbi:MAG: N4-gp56 family major capsid protein [Oleispira sp.]|nr:N4-gp56 family major capsid protein [Oleispira sp.]
MGTVTRSNKIFNAALFSEYTRQHSFANLLTGDAPKSAKGKSSQKQTDPHAPIVRVSDLSKSAGDAVEIDVIHKLRGTPTMGDRKLEGRGESMTTATMELKINQGRHMVDAGGKMAQKRTQHNLQQSARTLLGDNYYHDLEDQVLLYHMAGARGTLQDADSIMPLADHPEFAELMVNELMAPTYDRVGYGGDATSIDTLDAADLFSLDVVEETRLRLDEMSSMRIPSIKFKDDKMANESPLYVQYVSPRQLHDLTQNATTKDLNMMMANAMNRQKGFSHPLFAGECYMWKGILIKKMPRWVEFAAGTEINVSGNNATATTSKQTAGVKVHRSILLGGQAIANAYGNAGKGGDDKGYFGMTEEEVDHGNGKEISIGWMNGKKKIRFADKDGRVNDHGIFIMDTAVSG